MKTLFTVCILLLSSSLYGQEDYSELFTAMRDGVSPSIPAGYELNESRTNDTRSYVTITYDKGDDETDRLIYKISPGTSKFGEMDLAMATESFSFDGREALWSDGSATGMSSIHLLLKNGRGKFTLTHRAIGGVARDKPALEKLLSTVNLEAIENK